ncbi:hypothetical protein U1Q18_006548 [Sarracenia purpurea var. burkii]
MVDYCIVLCCFPPVSAKVPGRPCGSLRCRGHGFPLCVVLAQSCVGSCCSMYGMMFGFKLMLLVWAQAAAAGFLLHLVLASFCYWRGSWCWLLVAAGLVLCYCCC